MDDTQWHLFGLSSATHLNGLSARLLEEERLIGSLQAQRQAYEPLLVAARAEQHELMMDRVMRDEQDLEYQRSLAADQEKDRLAREAEEAAQREEEAKRRLEMFEVVLMRDWMHLSQPLVCARLGWCDVDGFQQLVAELEAQDRRAACRLPSLVTRPSGMQRDAYVIDK